MNGAVSSSRSSGQAMLIAVLSLGGAMLGATAIAGLLILYQIRAATDSINSSKAIFAADAGTDFALFSYYCANELDSGGNPRCSQAPVMGAFADGASTTVTCYDSNNNPTSSCYNPTGTGDIQYAVSIGSSSNAQRAFYLSITSASTSFP